MQLLTLSQAGLEPYKTEFKYRVYSVSLALFITVAIAIGGVIGAIETRREGAWFGVFICGWIVFWFWLFSWMIWRMLKSRLKATNWLVRTGRGEMLIKFRSYLNHHFPNDNPTVLRVAYSEIEWARAHKLQRSTPGFTRGDDWNQRLRYFEFRFRDGAHTEELHDRLVEERQRQGPREPKWYGSGSSRSRHYPVQIVDGNVRVEWGVCPSLKILLAEMQPLVAAAEPASSDLDYRDIANMPEREQEAMILQLIDSGDRMGAIRTIRHLYGYDLTRAVKFLDQMSQSAAK